MKWISVNKRLPKDGEIVLVFWGDKENKYDDHYSVMEFRKGRKTKDIDFEKGFSFCDQFGNNKVPYAWNDPHGPLMLFGQEVTYWAPIPKF